MLSAIDNWDDISNFDIPEIIKKESKVTERLLNYYITYFEDLQLQDEIVFILDVLNLRY
jgi:hypothetical protein